MAELTIYDDAGNIINSPSDSTGWDLNDLSLYNTINLNTDGALDTFTGALKKGWDWSTGALKKAWDWSTTPKGSGDNASAPVQWGLTGLGLLQQKKLFDKQLEEAKRQFAFSKGNTQANFMNQGTNFINQGLWQVEALNAFNPGAAAERAQNLNSGINHMNNAGSRFELGGNTFADQQNALKKYSQLANNGPRMA